MLIAPGMWDSAYAENALVSTKRRSRLPSIERNSEADITSFKFSLRNISTLVIFIAMIILTYARAVYSNNNVKLKLFSWIIFLILEDRLVQSINIFFIRIVNMCVLQAANLRWLVGDDIVVSLNFANYIIDTKTFLEIPL